jgi:hypothetical protein
VQKKWRGIDVEMDGHGELGESGEREGEKERNHDVKNS